MAKKKDKKKKAAKKNMQLKPPVEIKFKVPHELFLDIHEEARECGFKVGEYFLHLHHASELLWAAAELEERIDDLEEEMHRKKK